MAEPDVTRTAALGDGTFELARTTIRPTSYDGPTGSAELRAYLRIGTCSHAVDSLPGLVRIATREHIDLLGGVRQQPSLFAEFLAVITLGARVVTTHPLYDFVDDRLPLGVERFAPRVVGDQLLFLAGRFSLSGWPRLWQFQANLVDGTLQQMAVPLRPRPNR